MEEIWIQEARASSESPPTLILPTGTPELILYYGDPFVRLTDGGNLQEPRLAVGGPRTGPLRVRATGTTGILIFRFRPWGLSLLLRIAPESLRDRLVPLESVAGHEAGMLFDELSASRRSSERVDTVERFLEGYLTGAGEDPLSVAALARIRARRGTEPVGELAGALGVSRRHLVRKVSSTVGLGPKRFASLVRFQESTRYRGDRVDWANVARACGYCDQAHLIRAWQAFAGDSPERLLGRRGPTRLGAFFNAPSVSHSYNTTYL